MEKLTLYRHIFEAFSTLSDAQDLITAQSPNMAIERINHAKAHLSAVSDADPETWRRALLSGSIACSLDEGG